MIIAGSMTRLLFKKWVFLSLVAASGWLTFARVVAPPIVADAYRDRSLPVLNRLLAGRTRHPLGHYQGLWRASSDAVLLAIGAHLIVLAAASRRDERAGGLVPDRAIGACSMLFLAVTVLSGPRQDYAAFLEIWETILEGGDPWWIDAGRGHPLNAYGPLFNLFALPALANPLAPKLLVALAYLLFVAWFADRCEIGRRWALGYLLGPYFWIEIAYYGHLDVLVAIACAGAVDGRVRGRDSAAGAWLGLGVLLKFMPIVLLPFLAIDRRCSRVQVRMRFVLGATTVMGVGMVVSAVIWGRSALRPLGFAASRGSNLLSIFHYLGGRHSPLGPAVDAGAVDRLSVPLLVLAIVVLWLVCYRRRVDPATAAVLATLTTLLLYKVGFLQYQMTLFVLLADWVARNRRVVERSPRLRTMMGLYLGWITLFDILYWAAGGILKPGDRWYWLEDLVGLPTFLLGGLLLASLLATTRRGAGLTEPEGP